MVTAKNTFRGTVMAILGFAAMSLASCVTEQFADDPDAGLVTREFDASFVEEGTKTTLTSGGKIQWNMGDKVLYYSVAGGDIRNASVYNGGKSAHFSLKTVANAAFVTAVYGAESLTSPTAGSVVLNGIVQPEQSGRFDDAHVSVAYTEDFASERLSFYNLTSLLSFRLQRNDIAYVLFKPANAVPSGSARVSFSGGRPDISSVSPTGSNISSFKVFTSSGAGEYFISMFPGQISGGFVMEFYDYSNALLGTAESSKNLNLKVNTILKLGLLDNKITAAEQHGGTESGLYMGITGFNAFLYKYPIQLLNSSSVQNYYSFIDGLPQKNVTMLYYSVKDAIQTLQAADYPSDLSTVAIVTFTDGEDDGSLDYESYMGSESEYLNDVNNLLYNSTVQSKQIKAWTIGLQSEDASNPAFLTHLQKLSRPSSNGVRVNNMNAVNQQFQSIADELVNSFNVHNLIVRIAGKANGQKIRFTLDANISNPEYSNIYIEGYYDNQNKTLYDVSYHGLTAESGSDISSTFISDERLYEFTFRGLVTDNHSELLASNIIQWTWETDSGTYWKRRSEMETDENRRIETVRKSAVILLNLDCTTSLNGSLFTELKSYAKDFIARLNNAAYSPDLVSGVTLDNSSLTINVAESKQLTATVQPSTAINKNVMWSSSNPAIATVSSDGLVSGVKAGAVTITVTTEMGNKQAICNVRVVEPKLEAVDLGLPSGVKWATFNIGATSPEEFGDYFAWGETEPKADYSWSTYKWFNEDHYHVTKYCTQYSYWDSSAPMDNKAILDSEDDAAIANWSGSWRMPTDAEWTELRTYCSWTWTTYNGVNGQLVTGPNGNTIFLPAEGYRSGTNLNNAGSCGYYWSSSLKMSGPSHAWSTYFSSSDVFRSSIYDYRHYGRSVRPVSGTSVLVTGVTLLGYGLLLDKGETFTLTATVLPSSAKNKSVFWSSSDASVVSVDSYGRITGVKVGTAIITVTTVEGGYTATCYVEVVNPFEPEAVDLGLSVKWASFNLGATKPEEYGNYYAWGETEPKDVYNWSTYKFELGTDYNGPFSKYVSNSSYGTVDNKVTLDLEDDAASSYLGDNWRMPTYAEWTELSNNCSWTWTSNYKGTGIAGQVVASSNGNSIFLPAAGYRYATTLYEIGSAGYYWSSSIFTPFNACSASFYSNNVLYTRDDYFRCDGLSVRPVTK